MGSPLAPAIAHVDFGQIGSTGFSGFQQRKQTAALFSTEGNFILTNPVKARLKSGELVLGAFVTIPSPALTEMVGLSGFDFVVIDMEHGPVSVGIAEDMVRAA